MRFRDLSWRDIPAVALLDSALFGPDAWGEQTWWAELAGRPRREYVVALDESGGVIGYAGLDVAGEVADVMTIAVAVTHQGRGLGGQLIDELVCRAQARQAQVLMLEVRADNAPAVDLYTRQGFSKVGRRPRYYQPGDVDAIVMRRRVGS